MDRFARVAEAGREAGSWVIREAHEKAVHDLDLGRLVVDDVAREFEEHGVVGCPRLVEEIVNHRDRTFVVRNHQFQEQAVEVGATRCLEFGHLLRCRHAHHLVRHVRVFGMRWNRCSFASLFQPAAHECDLVRLGGVYAAGDVDDVRVVRPLRNKLGHLHRLRVVRNHVLHETHVVP